MPIYKSTKALSYVYICTHKVSGKFYVGYRCANLNHNRFSHLDLPLYKTSNPIIKKNFVEYNWQIVAEFFDSDAAYDFEQELINLYWNDPLLMNESCYYGKPRFKSKPISEEHKQSISIAQSKPKTQEHKAKLSAANKGNHWYNNGIKSVQSKECPIGFIPGRLILHNEGFKAGSQNPNFQKISPFKGKKRPTVVCPHCGTVGRLGGMDRHHFNNCKKRSMN